MSTRRSAHPIAMFCAWFLMVFLVLFPKGGIKFTFVPLTWGYLFLAISAPPALLVRVLALPLRLPRRLIAALALFVPMWILLMYDLLVYGSNNFGYLISTLAGLVFLPIIFLLIYAPFLPYVDGERLARYFRLCILFAALWGILLFVWHPLTGKFIEIPYLTVNAADYGDIENTKHINRGLFFKLISTYNNGNLYGACTLMFLPMYDRLEHIRWRRYAIRLALLMTLSRTVWAGLIFAEGISIVVLLGRQFGTFPRLYLGKATQRVGALVLTIGLVFMSLLFNANHLSFILDPSLGGRSGMFTNLSNIAFLPNQSVNGLQEAVYVSALQHFGITGFFAFTLMLLSPLVLLLLDSSALRSPMRRAALKGMVVYMFVANIDGTFNFIPTTAFFWFAYMIYLFGWPAAHRAVRARRISAPGSAPPLADPLAIPA
jgi:hypothetical protein